MGETILTDAVYILIVSAIGILVFIQRDRLKKIFKIRGVMDSVDIEARVKNLLDFEKQKELFHRLQPVLNTAEMRRKKLLKIYYVIATVMSVTTVLYTVYAVPYLLGLEDGNAIVFIVFGYLFQGMVCSIPAFYYRKYFKKHITPLIAESIGYHFEAEGQYTWSILVDKKMASFLFGSYSSAESKDSFRGQYKNKNISFEEIEVRVGNKRKESTAFSGLLMGMDAPKIADVPVVLKRDAGGKLGQYVNSIGLHNMEKVTLEDNRFEEEFDVYSTDQIKARSLLTPRFMEKLKNISSFYESISGHEFSTPVMAAFYEEKVFIAVKLWQDLFEPASFFTDARSKRNIELILAQIELQHQVVDSLE